MSFLFSQGFDNAHGVAGYDQLLVGADQRGLDRGCGRRDDGVLAEGLVGLVVDGHAHEGEVLQDRTAQFAVVLADAAGEDDEVDAVHFSDIGTDEADDVVGEFLEDEPGLGIAGRGKVFHLAGVGGLLRQAEEAGFAVEDRGKFVRGETEFLLEVEHGVGVDVAHAGAHDHALERGEAHGGIDALAVLDRADGTAGAEVAGDDLRVVQVYPAEGGTLAGDELVGSAVGAVAADAEFLVVLVGQGIHVGLLRHGLVEGGVEGHDLRNGRKDMLDRFDAEEVGRVVQRGEVAAEGDLFDDIVIDEGAAGEEIAALDDAVADGVDVFEGLEDAGAGSGKGFEDELHADFVVRDGQVSDDLVPAGGGILENTFGKADLFGDTLCDDIEDVGALHVKQLILDRGASAVDDENYHG